jgi:hypothetical protein
MKFSEELLRRAECTLRAFSQGTPLRLDGKADQQLIECLNSNELYERILRSSSVLGH